MAEATDPTPTPTPTPEPAEDATPAQDGPFTAEQQKIVDRIVQERVARVKATPPADYEDLKAKASKLDELEAQSKSELDKALERAAALERERDEAKLAAQETTLRSAIISTAAGKLADPTDAIALIDRSAIEFGEDGSPKNVEDLISSLLEAKPHLAAAGGARGSSADQGARGNGSQISRDQLKTMKPGEIVEAQKKGLLTHLLG